MSGLELVLLAASLFAIILILVAEARRGRTPIPTKIRPPMFVLRITLGVAFAILAVIGAFLPILQGWIFALLAFITLFPQSKLTIKVLDKAEPKMPRLVRFLHRVGVGVHRE